MTSSGVTGVTITGNLTYGGVTNYSKTNITDGTTISLSAPKFVSPNYDFETWGNINIDSRTLRNYTTTIKSNVSTTVTYTQVTTNYSGVVAAVTCRNEPHIYTYPWSDTTGFGLRFATPENYPDPGTAGYMPVKFNPSRNVLFTGEGSIDYISDIYAYPWTASGPGAKYSNPARVSGMGTIMGLDVNSLGNCVAVSSSGKGIVVYPWSNSSGFGVPFIKPSDVSIYGCDVVFSPSGAAIVVADAFTPFIHAYRWSPSTGFGAKYSNPVTLPARVDGRISGQGLAFSPSGDAIAICDESPARVSVYAWTDSTGFGTRYSNPSTLPTATFSNDVAFSNAGNAIVYALSSAPYIQAYQWSSATGFGSKFPNPTVAYSSGITGLTFTPSDGAIITSMLNNPFVQAISWSNSSGFGSRYASPASFPADRGVSVTAK